MAAFAALGWGAAAFLARVLWLATQDAARRDAARTLRQRPRLSDAPHIRRLLAYAPPEDAC